MAVPRTKRTRQAIEAKRRQMRQLKARFDVAHAKGMKALEKSDYAKLDEAIHDEREIIEATKRELPRASTNKKKAAPRKRKRP